MRRVWKLLLVPALLVGILPLAMSGGSSVAAKCPSGKPPPLKFGKPSYIDKKRAGGEPVAITGQDGSIIVSAHAGTTHLYKDPEAAPGSQDFVDGYANQTLNWRSDDGGKTWKYVGLFGQEAGPHTATSTGFSDPDLTMDASGRIYNVEINLANVAVFSSPDDGQSWPRGNPESASGDRPWVTGAAKDEVYLYVNSPKQLWRSTNGGLTWDLIGQGAGGAASQATGLPPVVPDGKLFVDPLNPKNGLIGPLGDGGAAISKDGGKTWKAYPAQLGISTQFFGTIAVDRAGWVYAANAGGYSGSSDTVPNGEVTFNYFNRKTNKWAAKPIKLDIPKGDAMWPWLIAGDNGRAAIVWYQTLPGSQEKFYAFAAYTTNAHGSYVRCSDGSRKFVPPQFSVANASGRPIHKGQICLAGTGCNANVNFEAGDRRLGDFFTVNFDHKGGIYVVSGDTMLQSPTGGEKVVGNPIFIKQTGGAPLLKRPDKIRKTRSVALPVPPKP